MVTVNKELFLERNVTGSIQTQINVAGRREICLMLFEIRCLTIKC